MNAPRSAIVIACLAAVLLAGACSPTDESSTTEPAAEPTATSISPTSSTSDGSVDTPAAPEPTVDRLVVLGISGEVVSMNRTGADVVTLSDEGEVAFQPIWDAASRRVSFGLVAPRPGLVIVDGDGTNRIELDLASNPFYLHWSADGTQLASLRNGTTGIAFEIFDVTEDDATETFQDSGAPYYFDWSPNGADLVSHVGTDRLDLLVDGATYAPTGLTPGFFSAPQYIEAGFVAPITRGGAQELVIVDESNTLERLLGFTGAAFFEVEPSAERLVAIQTVSAPRDGVSASVQITEPIPNNRLVVADRNTGEVTELTFAPVLAFFWSPYGEHLLYLEATGAPQEAQWKVWTDGAIAEGPAFRPFAPWVAQFIPFFEQYSRSMSLWAPDGSAYAFPGEIGDETGVWVVDLATHEPAKIADGLWVAWSPG